MESERQSSGKYQCGVCGSLGEPTDNVGEAKCMDCGNTWSLRPDGIEGVVLDLVDRKGPLPHDGPHGIMNQVGVYSSDEVWSALENLESDGWVSSEQGGLEQHGTARIVWYVDTGTGQPEVDHGE